MRSPVVGIKGLGMGTPPMPQQIRYNARISAERHSELEA
jgi:hypothetical protein